MAKSEDSHEEEYELTWKDDPAVCAWRKDEALAAGLTAVEAKLFSEVRDYDIMELRHLVKRGATVAQIRRHLFGPVSSVPLASPADHAPAAG